ncbi:dynamin-related protein 4C-like isoform X3 [Rhodamnia argentea]|uniref:Dynamin-related protein 4C-like isoform X1 n=1 Tax=Rhodamnia argentea TaxID=178133 RepID=A0A8B8Q133_9MYRT|nr:dynamin-related protein 4C-like isoform X1 [Rhodamnia argentea]XP_030540791.1 dynamin-related protein 4C-like isoform X2 [Rhodamnia argentea]XP_048137054.1 dynamin-related protein 4C-like isoform X3 [Rhodamnia argentea]
MRLQDNPRANCPELYLEFNGKVVPTDEDNISEAINDTTDEIAGSGKGISNAPLTLVVKKDGVPDLTMVDLPGITRVPVHGQPENIYEQISEMIMECIRPEESIILNVLSATVDFSTCESIRMSQMVDKTGKRTLAVVTKADKAPEGLLEKVTADDVNIGLGYVCVRNRIGDETYEEARREEAKLFDTHPLLSKIDKSIVGVPVLAQKLTQIQATIMAKCLPEIVKKINDKLNANVAELKRMPKNLSSVAEAMTAFMQILGSAKDSLRKVLLRGEFDEYPEEKNMHCTARLVEMLNQFSDELQNCPENDPRTNFLLEELEVLEEAKGIGLPNFLPRTAFLTLLQRKVKGISSKPPSFVAHVWDYIEGVVIQVLMRHSENYPQLQSTTRRATSNLINKTKEKAMDRMMEIIEMEKLTDYTCNPEYMSEWTKLMSQQNEVMDAINRRSRHSEIEVDGIGEVDVGDLRDRKEQIQEAFDLKMRITAYWKIVLGRFVDSMALHLLFDVQNLVNSKMEAEIVGELIGPNGSGGIERMLEEAPSVAAERDKLNRSVKLLRESAAVVAKIMDRIGCGDYND